MKHSSGFINLFKIHYVIVVVLLGIGWVLFERINNHPLDENATLTTDELLRKYGYPSESHKITTSDGYILTIDRIPQNTNKSKGVFLLIHGITCSSASWLITGTEKGLPFLLHNAGYDVWMGNNRGNMYSRNHTHLDPDKDMSYWEFSWHEMGEIDTPDMIDYILEITKQKVVFTVGYSQGTTAAFVMGSVKPEYNYKVKAHFSLAPVAYIDGMKSPALISSMYLIDLLFGTSAEEFLPKDHRITRLISYFCGDDALTQIMCEYTMFTTFGYSQTQMNASLFPVIIGHTPAGVSVRQFTHYGQIYKSGKFRQFDYGVEGNLKKYNSTQPPNYDLSKITSDMYIFYSETDLVITNPDVDRLYEEIGSRHKEKIAANEIGFNHVDFIYGIEAPTMLYKKIVEISNRY